jgi:tight adherence protein B
MFGLILVFLVVFALVALTISFGWSLQESQKKKKVTEMLQSSGGTTERVVTKVLLNPDDEGGSALSRLLSRFNFAQTMETQIEQAGLELSLNTLLIQMLVGFAIGAVVGAKLNILMFPLPSILALAALGGALPYLRVIHARSKRMSMFEEQFPDALDFLARAMRAGHAFSIALEMLSEESPQPLGYEFRKVFNEHNLGLPIEIALGNLTTRVPLVDVRFFVSAVLLQRETGGNLAEILTNLAFVIRERFKLKGQVKAASAHGRITGTILTLMPVVLMFGLMVIAPSYLKSMADDPDGRKMIAAVIVMIIIGHFVIRKIVQIKV